MVGHGKAHRATRLVEGGQTPTHKRRRTRAPPRRRAAISDLVTTDRCRSSGVLLCFQVEMIPTSALRRVFISSQNVARSACSTQTRGAGLTRNGISIIPGPSLEINQVSRLVRTFVRRTTFTHSQAEVATKPTSILQFVSSNVWKATHRTGGTSFASQFGQPPPRGPWQKLRDAFNRIPNNVIFYGILVLNGCIFVAWQYAHAAYVSV